MKLSESLMYHRKKNRLPQDYIGMKLHVSRQSVSKWEKGHCYPDIENLVLLAELYDISLDELVTGKKFFKKPFTVGKRLTRKELLKRLIVNIWLLLLGFPVLILGLAEFKMKYLLIGTLILLFFCLFIYLLPYYFSHWTIEKKKISYTREGRFVTNLRRFFEAIWFGDEKTTESIRFDEITEIRCVYKKISLDSFDSYTKIPRIYLQRFLGDSLYFQVIKTDGSKVVLDFTLDKQENAGNGLDYFEEIIHYLKKKRVVVANEEVVHAVRPVGVG